MKICGAKTAVVLVACLAAGGVLGSEAIPDEPLGESAEDLHRALASGERLDDQAIDRIIELQHTEVENVRLVLLPVSVEDRRGRKRHPARRWVVERTLGWLSKCRAILVRYDKNPSNYLGMIQLACALLWYRRLNVLR